MKNAKIFGFSLCILLFAAVTKSPVANAHDAPFDQKTLPYGTTWWCDTGESGSCYRTLASCKRNLNVDDDACEKQDSAFATVILAPKLTKIATPFALPMRSDEKCSEIRAAMLAAGAEVTSACAKVGAKPPPPRPALPKAKQYWCFGAETVTTPSVCGTTRQRCEAAATFIRPFVEISFECEARTRVWASYSRIDGDAPAFAISVSQADCETHREFLGLDGEPCIQLGRKKGPDDPEPAYLEATIIGGSPEVYYASTYPPPPPPPPPPPLTPQPQNVAPTELEKLRIGGSLAVAPPGEVVAECKKTGRRRMVATYKVCVSELGEVKGVQSLKTTGFPAYDEQIESTIYDTWRYKPYLVNGTAVAVCTAVTFKYERK